METRSTSRENARKRKLQLEEELEENKKVKKDDNANCQVTGQVSLPKIEVLNDDVLLKIFSYLTIKELIIIERVSKKWKEISLLSWINFKKINLMKDVSKNFTMEHLKDVLTRAGNYVTHLDLDKINAGTVLPSYIFSSINLCTNLTHLYLPLYSFEGRTRVSSISKKVAKNIKSLKIKDVCWKNRDGDLSRLLKNTINLEEFSVSVKHLKGTCFVNLPEKCKKLSIPKCEKVQNDALKQALERLCNIEHLNISDTAVQVETLTPVSKQLVSLDVSNTYVFFSDNNSYKSLSFPNLRILNLARTLDVNDDALSSIIENCPLLEELNINRGKFTGSTFRKLASLKRLTHLDLSNTNITSDCVRYLAQRLENLIEVYCLSVCPTNPTAVIEFIEHCPYLTCIRIGDSKNFYPSFFQRSELCVRERSSNLPLKIELNHYYYNPSGIICIQGEIDRLQLKLFDPTKNQVNVCRIVECQYPSMEEPENNSVWCVDIDY